MIAHSIQRRLQRDRRAFTLVELLVVITIITILASTALFTIYGVREDVRETRARAVVAKINELIMEKWESYRTRAVPDSHPRRHRPARGRRHAAQCRPRTDADGTARPDDRSVLADGPEPGVSASSVANPVTYFGTTPVGLSAPPSAWLAFQRRIMANTARGKTWTPLHEQSECLYMILAGIREADTTGLDAFAESEIGDTDNDGMPEILDPGDGRSISCGGRPVMRRTLQDPQSPRARSVRSAAGGSAVGEQRRHRSEHETGRSLCALPADLLRWPRQAVRRRAQGLRRFHHTADRCRDPLRHRPIWNRYASATLESSVVSVCTAVSATAVAVGDPVFGPVGRRTIRT